MIREAFHRPRGAYERKSETDPVTETDRAVEQYVFGRIRSEYTDHECVGEETAFATEISDRPTWIVDPIDGTANCKYYPRLQPATNCDVVAILKGNQEVDMPSSDITVIDCQLLCGTSLLQSCTEFQCARSV